MVCIFLQFLAFLSYLILLCSIQAKPIIFVSFYAFNSYINDLHIHRLCAANEIIDCKRFLIVRRWLGLVYYRIIEVFCLDQAKYFYVLLRRTVYNSVHFQVTNKFYSVHMSYSRLYLGRLDLIAAVFE
jgi:hypothetical protein